MSDSPGPYKGVKLAMEAIARARDAVRRAAQTQRPQDWDTAAQLFQEAANCRTRARLARGGS